MAVAPKLEIPGAFGEAASCGPLQLEQLLKVDPGTKRYSLGTGMLPLARAVLANSGFATLVQSELDRLSERYGVTAIGVGLSGMMAAALWRAKRAQATAACQALAGIG